MYQSTPLAVLIQLGGSEFTRPRGGEVLDAISPTVVSWTAETIVVVIVLMVLTDRLIPRRRLMDERERGERYQKAYEEERDAHSETESTWRDSIKPTLQALLAGQEMQTRAIEAMRHKGRSEDNP